MRMLDARGAELVYHDDFVPTLADFELDNLPLDVSVRIVDAQRRNFCLHPGPPA